MEVVYEKCNGGSGYPQEDLPRYKEPSLQQRRIDVNSVRCIFCKKLTSKNVFETRVLTAEQEIVRCKKPRPTLRSACATTT